MCGTNLFHCLNKFIAQTKLVKLIYSLIYSLNYHLNFYLNSYFFNSYLGNEYVCQRKIYL
jgi:hypothetical protein